MSYFFYFFSDIFSSVARFLPIRKPFLLAFIYRARCIKRTFQTLRYVIFYVKDVQIRQEPKNDDDSGDPNVISLSFLLSKSDFLFSILPFDYYWVCPFKAWASTLRLFNRFLNSCLYSSFTVYNALSFFVLILVQNSFTKRLSILFNNSFFNRLGFLNSFLLRRRLFDNFKRLLSQCFSTLLRCNLL